MLRVTFFLAIFSSVISSAYAQDSGSQWSEKHLSGAESLNFILFYIFKDPRKPPNIDRCVEYTSSIGEGFDRESTVVWSCKLRIDPSDFSQLISTSYHPLKSERVEKTIIPVCPTSGEFLVSIAYVTSESIQQWDINDTAIYVNSKSSELLVCYKVLIMQ